MLIISDIPAIRDTIEKDKLSYDGIDVNEKGLESGIGYVV
jgi:hypothetical protein